MAESQSELAARARGIISRLKRARPEARIELEFSNPLELLVTTILSAQCTDVKVNQVTRSLFKKYRKAADYARADPEELQEEIRPTGFFRQKTKSLIAVGEMLVSDFGGQVPDTMEEMLALPGVARKTANVVLGNAFGVTSGIVVDTHVHRVARRTGLSDQKHPEKVEQDLMAVISKKDWVMASTLLVLHGRYLCTARRPKCSPCPIAELCPRIGVTDSA